MIRRQSRVMALDHRSVSRLNMPGEAFRVEQSRRKTIASQLLLDSR